MLKRTSSEGSLYFKSRFRSLNNNKTSSSSGSPISLSSPPALFMQSSQDSSRIVKNPKSKLEYEDEDPYIVFNRFELLLAPS